MISNYALTLALLTYGGRASAACDGTIATFNGDCTFDNFKRALSSDCDIDVLFPPDPDTGDPTAADFVSYLCAYEAPLQFGEIQGTYQRDKRYFGGGGPLVDGGDWEVDSGKVRRFEDNRADSTVIAWPEYAARVQYNTDNGYGENGYPANMNLETECELKTAMCCFTDDTTLGKSFEDNGDGTTGVCHHDLANSRQSNYIANGWSAFPGTETPTHCVGFTWQDADAEIIGNMLYDVSLSNSVNKGYLKGVPGAPMCGCIENMPVVEEASCRTASVVGDVTYTFSYRAGKGVTASNQAKIAYEDCDNADLAGQFKANAATVEDEALIDAHLVGPGGCSEDVAKYLNDEEFLQEGTHPRWHVPDVSVWGEAHIGEGIHHLPPHVDMYTADAEFRALVEAGCQDGGGEARHCIVRRVCASCTSGPHRDMFYRRYTDLPDDAHFIEYFTDQWRSHKNVMGEDFDLFSTYEDAKAGTNAWTYCNYDYHGVGFARDCGPHSYVGCQWNSYTVHGGCHANHHAFYVEKPQQA